MGDGYVITAVVNGYEQTGPNSYNDTHYSRNFSADNTVGDILNWAQAMTGKPTVSINDVVLCDFTGSLV